MKLGRVLMPSVTFVFALGVSLAAHAWALFVPELDLSHVEEPAEISTPFAAELLPTPEPTLALKPRSTPTRVRSKPRVVSGVPVVARASSDASPAAVEDSVSTELANADTRLTSEAQLVEDEPPAAVAPPSARAAQPLQTRLPAQGTIRYRVDRGDQGFEIGRSTHSWEVHDGAYRMTAVTETTGLAALLKPMRIEWESRGRMTANGLQPEHFLIRRNGSETNERADFDWSQMQVSIGNTAAQTLKPGAQDLLSFHYQLALLPHPDAANTLTVITGKKSEDYQLEVLGTEEVKTPAGAFRTVHLRAPGDNATELWLAYDQRMLPVKIRHTGRDGDGFVELAVDIHLGID